MHVSVDHFDFDDPGYGDLERPLAAPGGRPLRRAEPAKLIGWLLLAAFGGLNMVLYVTDPHPFSLVTGTVVLGVLAGFVYSHRYPERRFSRIWVAAFSGLMLVAGLITQLAGIAG